MTALAILPKRDPRDREFTISKRKNLNTERPHKLIDPQKPSCPQKSRDYHFAFEQSGCRNTNRIRVAQ